MSIGDIRNLTNAGIQRGITPQVKTGEKAAALPEDGFRAGEAKEKSFSYSAKDIAGVLLNKPAVSTKKDVIWEIEPGCIIQSKPVLRDGTLYCSGMDNRMHALDPQTGKEKWTFEAEDAIRFSPIFDKNGTMFVFTEKKVYAVDTKKWESSWEVQHEGYLLHQPVIGEDGNIYYGESQKTYSLDTRFGIKKQLAVSSSCSPIVGKDGNLIVAGGSSDVFKIDKTTGGELWRFHRDNPSSITMAVEGPDGTVCFGTMDGVMYGLDGKTGKTKWKKSKFFGTEQYRETPTFSKDGKTVYMGSADGKLIAFATKNGKIKWKTKLGDIITNIPTPDNRGMIYAGTMDGKFCMVNEEDGKIIGSFTLGKKPQVHNGDIMVTSDPLIDENGTAYVGCFDKTFYAVNFDPAKTAELKQTALDKEISDQANEVQPESPSAKGIQHEGAFVIIGGVRIPVKKKG